MDKIAERVFALKRADLGKLREYGFKENEEGEFCLSCDIAEGRMRLGITVAADGSVRTKVTDVDTDDPYTLYLVEEAVGGFVGSVRADYERVLTDIAAKCFDREVFESGAAKAVLAYAERKYGNSAEYLWEKFPGNAVLRRARQRQVVCGDPYRQSRKAGTYGRLHARSDRSQGRAGIRGAYPGRRKVFPRLPHEQKALVHSAARRFRP